MTVLRWDYDCLSLYKWMQLGEGGNSSGKYVSYTVHSRIAILTIIYMKYILVTKTKSVVVRKYNLRSVILNKIYLRIQVWSDDGSLLLQPWTEPPDVGNDDHSMVDARRGDLSSAGGGSHCSD